MDGWLNGWGGGERTTDRSQRQRRAARQNYRNPSSERTKIQTPPPPPSLSFTHIHTSLSLSLSLTHTHTHTHTHAATPISLSLSHTHSLPLPRYTPTPTYLSKSGDVLAAIKHLADRSWVRDRRHACSQPPTVPRCKYRPNCPTLQGPLQLSRTVRTVSTVPRCKGRCNCPTLQEPS